MPNIIDTQQLQATAQVAKSFILEQDTANVTTIINALQSGGSAPAGKQEGIIHLTLDDDYVTVSYNGDGELRYITDLTDITYVENGVVDDTYKGYTVIQNGAQIERHEMLVFAPATDNFTAAFAVFGDN